MKGLFEIDLDVFHVNGPANAEELLAVEAHFTCSLSPGYREFMTTYNGGEGFMGQQYVILWRSAELLDFNHDYEAATYAPGLLLFGSNGGGEGIAFDLRDQSMAVVVVPFIGMSCEDARFVAASFETFLLRVTTGNATLI